MAMLRRLKEIHRELLEAVQKPQNNAHFEYVPAMILRLAVDFHPIQTYRPHRHYAMDLGLTYLSTIHILELVLEQDRIILIEDQNDVNILVWELYT